MGSVEHEGVSRKQIIQTMTLSKAFGTYGGAILGTEKLRQTILDKSKMFLGSTTLPLPLANAAMRSVQILKSGRSLRARLDANVKLVKEALQATGKFSKSRGPIVPVIPHSAREGTDIKRALLKAAIYPPFVKYATGPANGYFRFVIRVSTAGTNWS